MRVAPSGVGLLLVGCTGSVAGTVADPVVDAGEALIDAASCSPNPEAPTVVFLNRAGGTYSSGAEDSRANTSAILPSTVVAAPMTYTEVEWAALIECVRDVYEPFNVAIVDVDPEQTEHIEIAYFPYLDFFDSSIASISAFSCEPIPSGIGFVAYAWAGTTPAALCGHTVSRVSMLQGLEFTSVSGSPCDGTAYFCNPQDTPREFLDQSRSCGDVEAHPCSCGGGEGQNSYQALRARVGLACE